MSRRRESTAIVALKSIVGNLAEHEAEIERKHLVEELNEFDRPFRRRVRKFYGLPTTQVSYSVPEPTAMLPAVKPRGVFPDAPTLVTAISSVVPTPLIDPTAPGGGTAILRLHAKKLNRPSNLKRLSMMALALLFILSAIGATVMAIVISQPKFAHTGMISEPMDIGSRMLPFEKRDLLQEDEPVFAKVRKQGREGDVFTKRMARLKKRRMRRERRRRVLGSLSTRRKYRQKRQAPGIPSYKIYRPTAKITINPL